MTRRERLRGARLELGDGLVALVRRSCRNELRLVYEGKIFDQGTWNALAALGRAEVLRASQIHPAMKDVYRIFAHGLVAEGAVGASTLIATFRGPGRLRARHALQDLLRRHGV